MKRSPLLITCLAVLGICACLAIASQGFVSTRGHTNPPVVIEPNWDSHATRALAVRACFDCHSNETAWPWYTNIPPFSFLAFNDVREGRESLNFSEWQPGSEFGEEPEELGEVVLDGEMPPWNYLLLHPEARLSQEEKTALALGLTATALNR